MAINKVDLLVIDPQKDFCEPTGALFVPGADADMKVRLPKMIRRIKDKINDIHCTLDSHHYVDVAHPVFWRNAKGEHPTPFTIITAQDVEKGVWQPTQLSYYRRMLTYVRTLETNKRYPLCIWPPHCLIGSPGHAVVDELFAAFVEWEKDFAMVDYVTKGSNIFTEHYSAIKADVPDPEDPSTQINTALIKTLMEADIVAVAGEAGSHCLANTVQDIAEAFGDDSYVKKLVLLTDATSAVTSFEKCQQEFIDKMVARGMQLSTTTDFLS